MFSRQVIYFLEGAATACFGLTALMTLTATICFMSQTRTGQEGVLRGRLNAERLRQDDEDKCRFAVLDVPRIGVELLARPTVELLQRLVGLSRNVRV